MGRVIQAKQPEPPAEEVPIEVMATAIVEIAAGVKKLRAGPLKEKALVLLIQNAIPAKNRPSAKQITAVLDGVESLRATYLKPTERVQKRNT